MKIVTKKFIESPTPVTVSDCEVGNGYFKSNHGSLPDIDVDFNADRREEVKQYLEQRYNKNGVQRVFSAGTFTTLKIKSAIKDVARVHKVSQATANYLTKILESDTMSWTDLMRFAATDKRMRDFIEKNPEIFEEILPIMFQPRAAGIHASAFIIIPEYVKGQSVECFDLLPIRKMNGMLVSEISGEEIDKIGILKNDVLGIKELTRISDMLTLIERQYGVRHSMLEISTKFLNDPEVFKIIEKGDTQGIFQMNGEGMTKFLKRMKPDNINDLIAAVALYRPGPLNSGASDAYVRTKKGEMEPEYLWGTYEILNRTYGQMCYQEQISQVARAVGNLSARDSVDLVKALSKKKLDKVKKFQDKFFAGAKENGCPIDAANKIWSNVEDAAKYAFNMAHATSYGITAYIGAWLKTKYPTVFYSVVLKDQDESKMSVLVSEIEKAGDTTLEQPDINLSSSEFVADFKNNKIYWSLSRIKQLGPKAVEYILEERKLYGEFVDLDDFIRRIFKRRFQDLKKDPNEEISRCPITARHVKHLIFSGAFDKVENVGSILERYGLLIKASNLLDFQLTEDDVPDDMKSKHYFWSRKQISLCGHGAIDYKRILESTEKPKNVSVNKFIDFKDLHDLCLETKRGIVCATIVNVSERSYTDSRTGEKKHFGKIDLQQNTETNNLTIWEEWPLLKRDFKSAVGKMIIANAIIKWSDYDEKNVLRSIKNSFLKII